MSTVSLDDAQLHLKELIARLRFDEQLVIVQDGKPVATLARSRPQEWPCKAGSAKHTNHWMASDFDAPLEGFEEYMNE